jgi:site-specific DNA-methyltransferase (adenine-specific)
MPPVVGDTQPFDPAPLLRFPRVVLFGANHYADRLPPSPTWLVWDKRDGVASDDNADCELAWTNLGGPARLYRHLWRGLCRASEQGQRHLHPTQKPVALMAWIIANWTKPGDLILDPYMGSGPVLRAAKDLGRRAIGIEIEERYCEIAARRLGQEVLPLEAG